MARLPNPGSDHEQWGTVLNEYLLVAHNADGTPKDYVTPEMFGAVGDGIADDTNALTQMVASPVKNIILGRNAVYKITSELTFQNQDVNMNGATINANSTEYTRGVWAKSNTTIYNGKIHNQVTAGSPSSGEFGAGLLVGKFTFTELVENVVLRGLTISSTRPIGVALIILGRTHEVLVENCYFPPSAVLEGAITVHWGMETSTPSEGSYHPHNVLIRNCRIGNYSTTQVTASVISTAGAYNVTYENITIEGSSVRAIQPFIADYGFDFAVDPAEKKLAHQGIVYRNIMAKNVTGYGVDVVGQSVTITPPNSPENPYVSPAASFPVVFENVVIHGTGDSLARGFNFGGCKDVIATNCHVSNAFAAFVDGGETSNITLRNCVADSTTQHGFWIIGVANFESKNWLLDRCVARQTNTSSTGQRGGFFIDNQRGITIRDCFVDSPKVLWGFRVGTNVTGANLYNNFVNRTVEGGVGYSLGSTTVYTTTANFLGNTWDASVAYGVVGMTPLIVETRSNGTRRLRGAAKPTVNFVAMAGDTIENSARIEQGTAGSRYVVIGWECSIAGTPGTYLELRAHTGE